MHQQGDRGRRLRAEERMEILQRVAAGATFATVAAAIGCSTKSIQRLMCRTGGLAPRVQSRSPLRLSLAEREEISRGLQAGDSRRAIARRLGRAPSTVAREVAPHRGPAGYRAWRAEWWALQQARRPKVPKLARSPRLRAAVERLLAQRWSPEQIAHRLRLEHPSDCAMHISHETIYRSLFVQARGALRRELTACLRTGRTQRRARTRPLRTGRLVDMVLISARPAAAADRAVPGHWEGDLLLGQAGRSAIGSVVERRSSCVLLLRLPAGCTAEHVRRALAARMTTLPAQLRRTLTWDQGKGPGPGPGGPPPGAPSGPGPVPRLDWDETVVPVGSGPEGFDVSPDGKEAWVANAKDGTISVIDLATNRVVETLAVDLRGANRLKFTPDGSLAFVSTLRGPDVTVLRAATRAVMKRVPIGHGAAGIVMQADGARAYVACTPDDYVAVIDVKSLSVIGRVAAGKQPDGLAWVVRP